MTRPKTIERHESFVMAVECKYRIFVYDYIRGLKPKRKYSRFLIKAKTAIYNIIIFKIYLQPFCFHRFCTLYRAIQGDNVAQQPIVAERREEIVGGPVQGPR